MATLNHPKKGDVIKVEPIKEIKHIQNIKKLLSDKPRDLAIFVFGVNTNLRASDLLKIRVGHVRYANPGEHFNIREKKTGKTRAITINKTVFDAIQRQIKCLGEPHDNDFLFPSRKGKKALTVSYLNSLVKEWTGALNLKGNYGSHSLRKTFGFIHRTVHGTDIPTLMVMFNHNNQKQTLEYLCIQPEEIKGAYLKEI